LTAYHFNVKHQVWVGLVASRGTQIIKLTKEGNKREIEDRGKQLHKAKAPQEKNPDVE